MQAIHVDLLVLTSGNISHYVLIKDLGSFIRINTNAYHKHICRKCLLAFNSPKSLLHHQQWCLQTQEEETQEVLQFTSFASTIKLPWTIFADFESILKPINQKSGATTDLNIHKPDDFNNLCGLL